MRGLATSAILLALGGCVGSPPTRGDIPPQALEALRPGESDRTRVLLLLGEPDGFGPELFEYRTIRVSPGWVGGSTKEERSWIIWFDAAGRVTSWRMDRSRDAHHP